MYSIEGNDITITRGDSFMLAIETKGRVLANGTEAVLSVKEKTKDDTAVLTKTGTIASRIAVFSFAPSDTEELTAKEYHYSLRFTDTDGNVTTPIEDGAFVISEVV